MLLGAVVEACSQQEKHMCDPLWSQWARCTWGVDMVETETGELDAIRTCVSSPGHVRM